MKAFPRFLVLMLLLIIIGGSVTGSDISFDKLSDKIEGLNLFDEPEGPQLVGTASYYADKFHGRQTSSGEIFDMYALSAAHQSLPLGTMALVTNLDNGRSVRVKINDRGPFIRGRILDLSYAAAKKIGMIGRGTAEVRIEVLD